MPAERIIAIDFGTSTSVVRVKRYQDGKPIGDRLETKPVTFNMGSTVVPTLIQRRDTGESLYFGYDAEIPRRNTVILRNFKIEIEALDPAVRGRARELTADFFRYLYKTYREQSLGGHLGENDDRERTVISYPVKWSEDTKKFMLETAKNAGFPNVEGQDEAQAAIQAVTIQSEKQLRDSGYLTAGQPANILLIDMGAGTTDLVLCRHTPGDAARTEILATWPHRAGTLFGGQEVDELLRSYVKGLLPADSAEKVLKRFGADKFKAWKEHDVSPALARDETVNEFSALDDRLEDMELNIDYSIDRWAFEDFAQGYLRGFPELVSGCLNEAGMTGDQVDLVVLTGGHSQWYFVREILSGRLDRFGETGLTKIQADPGRVVSVARPQETVALGMAYSPISPFHMTEVDKLRVAATHSDIGAQVCLGVCYYEGDGVAQDHRRAVQWFRKAAEQGDADAQTVLGLCYYKGDGIAQDYGRAVQWLRKAAEQGQAIAQYYLGTCYYVGEGVAQNYKHAVQWFRNAAEQDDADARFFLGLCYKDGQGVEKDLEQARNYFKIAASQGCKRAADELKSLEDHPVEQHKNSLNDVLNSTIVQKLVAESPKFMPKIVEAVSRLLRF